MDEWTWTLKLLQTACQFGDGDEVTSSFLIKAEERFGLARLLQVSYKLSKMECKLVSFMRQIGYTTALHH